MFPNLKNFFTVALFTVSLFLLLSVYGSTGVEVAAVCSVVFTAAVHTVLSLSRFIPDRPVMKFARLVFYLVGLCLVLAMVLAVYTVTGNSLWNFAQDLLLYLMVGCVMWYVSINLAHEPTNAEDAGIEPDTFPEQCREIPDNITVRKRKNLHVIARADIIYIAAMGDYISIVTPEGRFVKEGTMAGMESGLGVEFVRIHRSTIVNITRISAVELYGKHSHSVKLKTGELLRTSAAGYRLLRARLG